MIARRKFLGSFLGLGAGLVSRGAPIFNSAIAAAPNIGSKLEDPDEFLKTFPEKIPGARSIRKYPTRGARQTLVHILQAHYTFNPAWKDLEKTWRYSQAHMKEAPEEARVIDGIYNKIRTMYRVTNKCQRDIFSILQHLNKAFGLREIFSEGIERAMTKEELSAYYSSALAKVLSTGIFSKEEKDGQDEEFLYIPGADVGLGMAGEFTLLPSYVPGSEEKMKTILGYPLDGKEDDALRLIRKDGRAASVILFGGQHAFGGKKSCGGDYDLAGRPKNKDNLAEYDGHFSLIEVTPNNMLPPEFFKDVERYIKR